MKLKIVLKRKRTEDECHDQVQENGHLMNKYGDGVAWRRGAMLGEGGFGSVYLAIPTKKLRFIDSRFPLCMAVKSAELSVSQSIQEEKEVLSSIRRCPNIIRFFGDEITVGSNDTMVYNLLLEYASGGSLGDRINKAGKKGLPESEVRCFSRSILKGILHIHEAGYVHRDLKPDNILLVPKSSRLGSSSVGFTAKICDFGMAKRVEQQSEKWKLEPYWKGTPMFLSPEAAKEGVQNTRGDIWSLGCIVLQMLTGKPPWDVRDGPKAEANILKKLEKGKKFPNIPRYLSKDAKGFVECCLEWDVSRRLSAKTLLTHPFVEAMDDNGEEDDEFEEEEEIEDMDHWSSLSHIVEEQSCCFQSTPLQNRPQHQFLVA